MRMRPRRIATLSVLLCLAACSSKPADKTKMSEEQVTEQPPPATLEDITPIDDRAASTMEVLLSNANPRDQAADAVPVAKTVALTREETQAVLARMPELKAVTADAKDFAKRAGSLPPPRAGETITTEFPPASDRARPAAVDMPDTALAVERFQPEGETPIAPHLSVTFNEPMVTVASHADAIAQNVPVTIQPAVDGQWRWVGTKTLLFEPTVGRFPMATEFTVTIPAGTKAATGKTLAQSKTWKFGTPPPEVVNTYPGGGTFDVDQVMFVAFNQKIDRQKVLEHMKLNTGKIFGKGQLVLAESEHINEDEQVRQLVETAKDGQWIAVRSGAPLPYDSTIRLEIPKGTPSAEGPRTTTQDNRFNFQTYGPFEVVENRCGWSGCSPHDSFSFRLANNIDDEKFDASLVKVEPSFPTMTVNMYGDWIHVQGQKPGRRTYKVTLDRSLQDEFGQHLVGDNTFKFDVGPSMPELFSTSDVMNVLDPSSDPSFSVFSVNYAELAVTAWKVEPADWGDYLAWTNDYNYYGKQEKTPPGRKVFDEKIVVEGAPDDVTETRIELSRLLGENKRGNIVLSITPTKATKGSEMPRHAPQIRTWAQATDIGLDGFVDNTEFVAWTSSLDDGEPLGGAEVELFATDQKGKTDSTGIAKIELAAQQSGTKRQNMLIARHNGDQAFLPEQMWGYGDSTSWVKQQPDDTLAWFTFDDRGMYRPKEKVTVKGWIRAIENREQGSVRLATGATGMTWTAYDAQNNEIGKGKSETTELGGFSFDLELPETPNLGSARVEINARGVAESNSSHVHFFQIQEFRTPEFEVKTSAPEGPFFATDAAVATVEASYYAGGGLPNADVQWYVTTTQSSFTPPNQHEFTFGSWTPWWASPNGGGEGSESQNFTGKTDATGAHYLKLAFGAIQPPRPMTVQAQATVFDVNRQAWTSTTNLLVHPSKTYVGLRSDRYFVEKGKPLEIELVVADVDGNRLVERPVKARAARVQWSYKNGQYTEEEVDPQTCEFLTSAQGLGKCTFKTDVGGTYRIVATTVDDHGRRNFSEITRWVSGGKQPVARRVEQEEVTLIPDKDEYQPGDTAEILVQSPIVPAEVLYTLQRNGMIEEKRITMSEPTTTLAIPIKASHFPNLRVQVNVIGSQPRLDENGNADDSLPRRPAFGRGAIDLRIPPHERVLDVALAPEESRVEPGKDTWVDIEVKDAAGKPVSDAEVAVVVVDEAILALSSYQMADPIAVFYPQRPYDTREYHLRSSISLVDPAALRAANPLPELGQSGGAPRKAMRGMKSMPAPSAAAAGMETGEAMPMMEMAMAADEGQAFGGGAESSGPIAVRTNFDPLATFAPAATTDASGKARVSYKMPDNLTRYRIMAVAVRGGQQYGTGEDNVTARLPLMVRPSAPRFLNFGDKFDLPVVLQNQTDEPMEVRVASRGTNVEFVSNLGWKVQVPANDRVEVRFPAAAAMAGTARFQVGASAGPWADASEFSLPVWTPATSEAFATYGVIDEGSIVQPVAAPTEVWPQFGGLEITTSSTALQALTDAFIYLYEYQYQCAEQISSRMVSVAALRDVLTAFEAEGMPSPQAVEKSMKRDIDELASRQNHDGGFGFWRSGQESWPYVSIHAAHALARAKQKGYEVPPYVLDRSKNYLRNIESHIPGWWPQWLRLHTIAYALYVRNQVGDKDPAKAREIIQRGGSLEKLSFESVGWLLGTLTGQAGYEEDTKEIRRFLNNRVTETAAGAHFAAQLSDESDYLILRSDRVADGVILEALIEDQPKSDLIPKIVNGLLAHRKKGRWGNTQENAFILLALDKYFNTFEGKTPDFVARVWLGDQYAGDHKFKGRTTERHHIDIPMKVLADQGGSEKLYLQKDGTGRMYYRIGMSYAPKSLFLEPADHGFVVERAYEPVDNDTDVKRRNDGTWEIKAGAKVRINVTMVAPTRRYHVALVDPLPAGLETLNPALAVTGDVPQDPNVMSGRNSSWGWWWWTRPWFEHQNMRDERTEAFTTLLWGGVHTYTYYARATTPGEFVVPPAKAEEMYHPETFGRSASDRVAVVD